MLKYLKQYKGEDNWEEIDFDTALATVLNTFRDCDMVRDMLTIPNWIPCRFSTIRIVKDGTIASMPGLSCMVPPDSEYDESGNRLN